jgi:thiosulfate reductase cytochrome b subunit
MHGTISRVSDSVCIPTEAPAISNTATASRHSATVRITHWITTLCFLALLVSGAEIVISHPRFYWGETGNDLTQPLFKLPIPASRNFVPTGYRYVLPDQNGWSRYLHFQAAWVVVFTGLLYAIVGLLQGISERTCSPAGPIFRGGHCRGRSQAICTSSGRQKRKPGRITHSSGSLTCS